MPGYWDQYEIIGNPDNPVSAGWQGQPSDTDPVYGNQVNTGILNPTGPLASPTSTNPNYVSPAQGAAGYIPPAVTGQGSAPGDAAAFIRQWQDTHPPSQSSPQELIAALRANGFNASPYMYGNVTSGNEINLNGEKYKVIGGENSGSPFWYHAGDDDSGGGLGSGAFSLQGQNGVSSFNAPGLLAPFTERMSDLSYDELLNDPGFQFRLATGTQAINRDNAVKGMLKSGGTLKDLTAFSQGLASDEIQNAFNRRLQSMGFNRGTFWGNQENAFGRLNSVAGQGGAAASQYAGNASDLYTGQGDANAAATANRANAWNSTVRGLGDFGYDLYQRYAGG